MANRPKFVTFDCHGTLIHFDMAGAARDHFSDHLDDAGMEAFIADFSTYRRDEIMGPWKPYREVVAGSLTRTCAKYGLTCTDTIVNEIYARVPTWVPHPDVPEGLDRVANEIPLVILSNAMESQIRSNVANIGVPFAHVLTAEKAGVYKPQLKAFEYMFDQLDCGPEDIAHVSSSFRYDLMSATDLGIGTRIWVDRGHEPHASGYATHQISDIGGLAGALGL